MKNSVSFLAIVLVMFSTAFAEASTVQHTVKPGETLQTISWKYFGTTRKWYKIFKQNKNILETPDSVEPGMTLSFEGPTTTTAEAAAKPVTPAKTVAKEVPAAVEVVPTEDLRTLVTQAGQARESAQRIQSHSIPQRSIATAEKFSAIEADSSENEQPIRRKRVNFRFGSRQLIGPEF